MIKVRKKVKKGGGNGVGFTSLMKFEVLKKSLPMEDLFDMTPNAITNLVTKNLNLRSGETNESNPPSLLYRYNRNHEVLSLDYEVGME